MYIKLTLSNFKVFSNIYIFKTTPISNSFVFYKSLRNSFVDIKLLLLNYHI